MFSLLFNKALRRFYLDNKHLIIKMWNFIKDWRTMISFLLAWLITNGWGYIFIVLGNVLDIKWMFVVGTSYIAFLWMPFTTFLSLNYSH